MAWSFRNGYGNLRCALRGCYRAARPPKRWARKWHQDALTVGDAAYGPLPFTVVTIELHALFDGHVPGLSEHRLSLGAFAEPLKMLLFALQRTASGLLSAAIDTPGYGTKGGKLAIEAKQLDLELLSMNLGCVEAHFACTTHSGPGSQMPLMDGLAAQAVERLVRDIDAEAKGTLRNAAARKFLEALPAGITRARWYAALYTGCGEPSSRLNSANRYCHRRRYGLVDCLK